MNRGHFELSVYQVQEKFDPVRQVGCDSGNSDPKNGQKQAFPDHDEF